LGALPPNPHFFFEKKKQKTFNFFNLFRRTGSLVAAAKDFSRYWTFLTAVVKRDIKRKYYRSSLGLFWTVLHPLLMTAIFYIVFTMLFSGAIPNFPLYLLSGQLLFQFNTEASSVS